MSIWIEFYWIHTIIYGVYKALTSSEIQWSRALVRLTVQSRSVLEGRPRGLIIFKQISLNLQQTNDFCKSSTCDWRATRMWLVSISFKLKLTLKATLKTSMESSRFCKSTKLLIAQVASSWTPPAWNATCECQLQSLHNLSPKSLH